jgi:hypothetical protein
VGRAPATRDPTWPSWTHWSAWLAALGCELELAVVGAIRPLPPTVDLAAYRIVQEELTNVLRHAGSAPATVQLTYREHALTVQVDDDGHASAFHYGSRPSSWGLTHWPSGPAILRQPLCLKSATFHRWPGPHVLVRLPSEERVLGFRGRLLWVLLFGAVTTALTLAGPLTVVRRLWGA